MASVSLFNLSAGTTLGVGDVLVFCDISDTTQSANGSDLKITITNFLATLPAPVNVTSASATALAVGRLGATTPAFTVDASTASQVAGLKVTGAGTGGTVAVVVTDSGTNASLTINAKGSGTIGIGSVSTGAVTITPATTITGALTANAGVVIAASQALTGTVANSTISGFLSVAATTGTFTNVGGTLSTATQNSVTTMTGLVSVGALASGSTATGFGALVGTSVTSSGAISGTNFLTTGASVGTSGAGVLAMLNATAPSTSPANVGQLYVLAGALMFRGASGTITTVAVA